MNKIKNIGREAVQAQKPMILTIDAHQVCGAQEISKFPGHAKPSLTSLLTHFCTAAAMAISDHCHRAFMVETTAMVKIWPIPETPSPRTLCLIPK